MTLSSDSGNDTLLYLRAQETQASKAARVVPPVASTTGTPDDAPIPEGSNIDTNSPQWAKLLALKTDGPAMMQPLDVGRTGLSHQDATKDTAATGKNVASKATPSSRKRSSVPAGGQDYSVNADENFWIFPNGLPLVRNSPAARLERMNEIASIASNDGDAKATNIFNIAQNPNPIGTEAATVRKMVSASFITYSVFPVESWIFFSRG